MRSISTGELKDLIRGEPNLTVLDVSDEGAFSREHVPNSTNIPFVYPGFEARVQVIAGGRDRSIVVYCSGDHSAASSDAAEKLDNDGFARIYHYEGGMEAWKRAGLPIASGR